MLKLAAFSPTPDWRDKVEWLLGVGVDVHCDVAWSESDAGLPSGGSDMSGAALVTRLTWHKEHGLPFGEQEVLWVLRAGDEPEVSADLPIPSSAHTKGRRLPACAVRLASAFDGNPHRDYRISM